MLAGDPDPHLMLLGPSNEQPSSQAENKTDREKTDRSQHNDGAGRKLGKQRAHHDPRQPAQRSNQGG
jgi:hypothetical protein